MAVFYLDLEGGNDANAGTSFALRWKTFISGATAARIAPGDEIRVMASPTPTSLGQTATWTNNSANITLTSAVTQLIDDCEAGWTASTNVTATAVSGPRSGTNMAAIVVASAFTTGLIAFKATGTLNLAAYQQVSFWIKPSIAVAASTLTLNLCSDVAGVTSVNTIAIPALPVASVWYPIVVDTAGALGSSIQSVAIKALLDPGTITINLDNINACKASSSADSLTLNSLIAKIHQQPWVASATYSLNDIRIPTTPNRTGLCYKVTTAGTASGSEPTWPEYPGGTVTDNTVVWTAQDAPEDGWYPIGAINGTTVTIDCPLSLAITSRRGYPGTTETVTTYKREPIVLAYSSSGTTVHLVEDVGSHTGGLITYTGGWDRSAMTTQAGETACTFSTGAPNGFGSNTNGGFYELKHFTVVRAANGFIPTGGSTVPATFKLTGCRFLGCDQWGITDSNAYGDHFYTGCQIWACGQNSGFGNAQFLSNGRYEMKNCTSDGCINSGWGVSANGAINVRLQNSYARTNANYGISNSGWGSVWQVFGGSYTGNGTADINDPSGTVKTHNATFTNLVSITVPTPNSMWSGKINGTAGNHKTNGFGFNVVSDTTTVHTALSWKFTLTSVARGAWLPVVYPVGQILLRSGVTKAISIWHRRSSTNIQGTLRIRGGQLAGIGADVTTSLAPSINTWTQSSTLSVTPTEDGIVEVEVLVWDGVGTTNNFWVDDLIVA